ncbi:MAG: site-specific DNA-methyltransferase [bacterium]
MKNILIHGENISGLKLLLNKYKLRSKVDLIYIDPPFATNNSFLINGNRTSTISASKNGDVAYSDKILGDNFIDYLKERIVLLKDLLSEDGSIYIHTDYKIGHYVKIMMDDIFGVINFRNDITRIKCNPKNFQRKGFGNIKDLILFYSKSDKMIWNEPFQIYSEKDREKLFPKIDKDGRRYTTVPIHAPGETINGNSSKFFKGISPPEGRHWRADIETLEKWDKEGLLEWSSTGNPRKKLYFDEKEGKRYQDIWEFKDPQYPLYPTEKNSQMLDLIIKTSSNVDSIVLDCFCGSGTTLKSAQLLNRKWIGIDKSEIAINKTIEKIKLIENNLFSNESEFEFVQI